MSVLHRKETVARPAAYRGVYYYELYESARKVADNLRIDYPGVRIVFYARGWAIQQDISGSYFGPKGWS